MILAEAAILAILLLNLNVYLNDPTTIQNASMAIIIDWMLANMNAK